MSRYCCRTSRLGSLCSISIAVPFSCHVLFSFFIFIPFVLPLLMSLLLFPIRFAALLLFVATKVFFFFSSPVVIFTNGAVFCSSSFDFLFCFRPVSVAVVQVCLVFVPLLLLQHLLFVLLVSLPCYFLSIYSSIAVVKVCIILLSLGLPPCYFLSCSCYYSWMLYCFCSISITVLLLLLLLVFVPLVFIWNKFSGLANIYKKCLCKQLCIFLISFLPVAVP